MLTYIECEDRFEVLFSRRPSQELIEARPDLVLLRQNMKEQNKHQKQPLSRYKYLRYKIELQKPLTLEERKDIVLSFDFPRIQKSLLKQMNKLLEQTISISDRNDPIQNRKCWIFPREPRSVTRRIVVRAHFHTKHKWDLQFGLAALRLYGKRDRLTHQQKEGLKSRPPWELSHLCGNWRCLNSDHFTVEHRDINASRNKCFRRKECAGHFDPDVDYIPPCMIHHHIYKSENSRVLDEPEVDVHAMKTENCTEMFCAEDEGNLTVEYAMCQKSNDSEMNTSAD
jgi:hypothetical protein